jgi:hypothetical protein
MRLASALVAGGLLHLLRFRQHAQQVLDVMADFVRIT